MDDGPADNLQGKEHALWSAHAQSSQLVLGRDVGLWLHLFEIEVV